MSKFTSPRYGWRDATLYNWHILAGVAGVLLLIVGCVYFVTYRKTETVVVNSRYWTWDASVKYDTTSTSIECSTSTSCSWNGTIRTCSTKTDCRPVTRTTAHTRCRNMASGIEQFPYRPELCPMQYGDYLSDSLVYHIDYRVSESEKTGKATFDGSAWDKLAPGSVVKITLNAMSRITKIEGSKRGE